ncbi:MAG TPA: hypothetical protein VE090_01700 [Methylomirabilota bacterium]|nr:hypothetical protein [Methylomirabilota bacterium]
MASSELSQRPEFVRRPIERPIFDLRLKPWKSNTSLRDQLSTKPFCGEGFLYHATTEQLRETLAILTKDWEEAELVKDTAAFAAKVHKDDKRKDEETPYEHHLLRGAIRLAQLKETNTFMITGYLLHDTVEDHNTTVQEMLLPQNLGQHPSEQAKTLHDLATALSVNRGKGKLEPKEFYKNINEINARYPEAHPWLIKGVDRFDNAGSDLSFAIRHDNPRVGVEKIKKYRKKTSDVIPYIKKAEPNSPVLARLQESLRLGGELMRDHGLKDPKNITIIFNRLSFLRPMS